MLIGSLVWHRDLVRKDTQNWSTKMADTKATFRVWGANLSLGNVSAGAAKQQHDR